MKKKMNSLKIVNNAEVEIKVQLERYKNGLITKDEFIDFLKKDIKWIQEVK